METEQKKQLVLALLRDDLRIRHLVNGLNRLGLDADDYLPNLSQAIFTLMGITVTPQNEALYTAYEAMTNRQVPVYLPPNGPTPATLAEDIYEFLLLHGPPGPWVPANP